MFWITFKRVLKAGWVNFKRNSVVSSAAVLVTTITLFMVMGLFVFHASLNAAITTLQSRVDIAVYFTVDAPEEQILSLQTTLQKLPEVGSVTYQSADDQVQAFRNRHSDDYLTLEALDELGDNPFGGSLLIKAKDSSQYEAIAQVLEGDTQVARDNAQIIDRINYAQNKEVIDRLNTLIDSARTYGLGIIIILALVSIIIMFTTVRLTIYMSREEVGVMKLVGASNWFIRMPFVVEGMLYGFFAWLLTLALFLVGSYFVGPHMSTVIGLNIYSYIVSHIISVGLLVLGIGLVLGIVSSLLAVRRYLKV